MPLDDGSSADVKRDGNHGIGNACGVLNTELFKPEQKRDQGRLVGWCGSRAALGP